MKTEENNQEIKVLETVLRKDYLGLAKSKSLLFDGFSDEKPSKNYKQLIRIEPIVFDQKKRMSINYTFCTSCFGNLIIASTSKGICYLAFDEDKTEAIKNLKSKFLIADFSEETDVFQRNALLFLQDNKEELPTIKLHLKGTEFQIKVWEILLRIPKGKLATYLQVAKQVRKFTASRAVGTAIGNNLVAYIIPCHRVIQSSGKIGNYRWGKTKKIALIKEELSQIRLSD